MSDSQLIVQQNLSRITEVHVKCSKCNWVSDEATPDVETAVRVYRKHRPDPSRKCRGV